MQKYIITIKKDSRAYMFGRYYPSDYEKMFVIDVLEALFHIHVIDEFLIKEVPEHE